MRRPLLLVLSLAAFGCTPDVGSGDGASPPDTALAVDGSAVVPDAAPMTDGAGPGDSLTGDAPMTDDALTAGDAGDKSDAAAASDAAPAPDGPVLSDGGMMDGPIVSCSAIGQACVSGASCCSGICDPMGKVCSAPAHVCAPQGAACGSPADCCSLTCSGGKCGAQCKPNAQACAAAGECCSGSCVAGTCQPVVMGGCVTLGNKCNANGDCCSQNCQGGLCAPQGGACNALGDVCYTNADCCSALCTIPMGMKAGTCANLNGGGGGNCTKDGEPCMGCSNCCSHVCAPTLTGGHICEPASGCRVIGDVCHKDSDCCGGGNTNLPGANSVVCNIVMGTMPPTGTCSNPNGCDPDGDVCGLMMNNTCGNARHDCCDCIPPKINCCKFDKAGVPRCYGGSTMQCPNGYTGKQPCCISAGNICAFSSECCDGTPCVPDMKGQLRCGTGCQKQGDVCTADSDCCVGSPCYIPKGSLSGTCQPPPPPPPPPPDMVMAPPDMAQAMPDMAMRQPDLAGADLAGTQPPDLATPPDLGKAPDLAQPPCPLIGQSCTALQPCCNGLICAPPSGLGVCPMGELDCTCVTQIF